MPSALNDVHPGMKFGCLTVKSKTLDGKWVCECICGRQDAFRRRDLKYKKRERCTCQRRSKKGSNGHPLYAIWYTIVQRTENQKCSKYSNYGGRGIKMCSRWRKSFSAFVDDMGDRPTKSHSINRINNDGDYEPGNCRWDTSEEQSYNKTTTVYVVYKGECISLTKLARKLGIKPATLRSRVVILGWSIEKATKKSVQNWGR